MKRTKTRALHNETYHDKYHVTDHLTDVCSVTWPLNGSEAGGDLVLIQTSLPLLCKTSCSNAN